VSYRGYKISAIDGDKITVAFDLRQYSAGHVAALPDLPKGSTLEQFESVAKGEYVFRKTELLADRAKLVHEGGMVLKNPNAPPPPNPGQLGDQSDPAAALAAAQAGMMRAQMQIDSRFSRAK